MKVPLPRGEAGATFKNAPGLTFSRDPQEVGSGPALVFRGEEKIGFVVRRERPGGGIRYAVFNRDGRQVKTARVLGQTFPDLLKLR